MATNMIAGRTYARAWMIALGVVLVLLGVLGFVVAHPLGAPAKGTPTLNLEGGELWVHLVLGVAFLGIAFGVKDEGMLNTLTVATAIVFILVGVVGFVMPKIGVWHVGTLDNVTHVLVGAVTAAAWWMSKDAAPGPTMGRPAM